MSKVRFKNGNGIAYEVLDPNAVWRPDEVTEEYCQCILIETLGWVPIGLLEPSKDTDVDTKEVIIELILKG